MELSRLVRGKSPDSALGRYSGGRYRGPGFGGRPFPVRDLVYQPGGVRTNHAAPPGYLTSAGAAAEAPKL